MPPGTCVSDMQYANTALARLLEDRGFRQCSGHHLMHLSAGVGVAAKSLLLKKSIVCPWTKLQYPWTKLQYLSRLTVTS
jgi:hypothetical protein